VVVCVVTCGVNQCIVPGVKYQVCLVLGLVE
jgi:hypothetical protein